MTRNEARAANYAQTRVNAKNARRPWSQEEDRAIATRRTATGMGSLQADLTDRELSKILGRSVQAIQVRRTRLPYVETCSDCRDLGRGCGRTPA
jgi:hypothetical protein